MRKKLLIFLGLFVLMIIPNNVFAKESVPWYSQANNTIFSDNFNTSGSVLSYTISSNSSNDFNFFIHTMDLTGASGTYPTFSDYPYVWLFFESVNEPEEITITRAYSCSNSCFNHYNMVLKKIGINPTNQRNRYVLILPVLKYKIEWGTNQTLEILEDTLRFTNNTIYNRNFTFTNILLSDSADIESVADYSSIINSANTNTTNIINSANANAQNIINSQNTNTQNIITNDNTNQQQTHNDLTNINGSLNNEEAPTNNDNANKANEWASKTASTNVVSQMVLMPITLLTAFSNNFYGVACSSFDLGNFYGTRIVFPCINLQNFFGPVIWNVIDILMTSMLIYAIGKKMVKVFNDFTNLKDNQIDELYGGGK